MAGEVYPKRWRHRFACGLQVRLRCLTLSIQNIFQCHPTTDRQRMMSCTFLFGASESASFSVRLNPSAMPEVKVVQNTVQSGLEIVFSPVALAFV